VGLGNKLRLMFNDHHLQKHWKLYVGWFGVPLIALLVSKLTGILDMLMQAMSNK